MAFTYGFYNSINGDRRYDAQQMSAIFDGIITDGVFSSVGGIFATVPGEGMTVVVKSGRAWFDHTWSYNDGAMPLSIDAADVTMKRYDAVVLEVNNSEAVRENAIKVVKGTPATNPVKPGMTNTETIHQHPLAYVLVDPGVTSITADKIDIRVGKSDCPFSTAILQTVSIDDLFNAWESEFDQWFANVQAQLEGNIVTNLQKQIDDRVKIADKATSADLASATPNKWVDAAGLKESVHSLGEVILTMQPEIGNGWYLCNGEYIPQESFPDFIDSYLSSPGHTYNYLRRIPSEKRSSKYTQSFVDSNNYLYTLTFYNKTYTVKRSTDFGKTWNTYGKTISSNTTDMVGSMWQYGQVFGVANGVVFLVTNDGRVVYMTSSGTIKYFDKSMFIKDYAIVLVSDYDSSGTKQVFIYTRNSGSRSDATFTVSSGGAVTNKYYHQNSAIPNIDPWRLTATKNPNIMFSTITYSSDIDVIKITNGETVSTSTVRIVKDYNSIDIASMASVALLYDEKDDVIYWLSTIYGFKISMSLTVTYIYNRNDYVKKATNVSRFGRYTDGDILLGTYDRIFKLKEITEESIINASKHILANAKETDTATQNAYYKYNQIVSNVFHIHPVYGLYYVSSGHTNTTNNIFTDDEEYSTIYNVCLRTPIIDNLDSVNAFIKLK